MLKVLLIIGLFFNVLIANDFEQDKKEFNIVLSEFKQKKSKTYLTKLKKDLIENHKKTKKAADLIVDSLYNANKFIWGVQNIKERVLLSYSQLELESDFRVRVIKKDSLEHSSGLSQIRKKTIYNDLIPLLDRMDVSNDKILKLMKWNFKVLKEEELLSYVKNIQINIYSQVLVHYMKSKYRRVINTNMISHNEVMKKINKYNLVYAKKFFNQEDISIIANSLVAYNGFNIIRNKDYSRKLLKKINRVIKRTNIKI